MGGCGAKVLGRPCRSWVKVGSGEPFAESPSTPMNGHHQSGPAGPFRAKERTRYRGRALAGRSGYYVYHHNYLSERT